MAKEASPLPLSSREYDRKKDGRTAFSFFYQGSSAKMEASDLSTTVTGATPSHLVFSQKCTESHKHMEETIEEAYTTPEQSRLARRTGTDAASAPHVDHMKILMLGKCELARTSHG